MQTCDRNTSFSNYYLLSWYLHYTVVVFMHVIESASCHGCRHRMAAHTQTRVMIL